MAVRRLEEPSPVRGEGEPDLAGVKAKLLQRGLHVGKQMILVHGLARRVVPGNVWQELHAYYRLAEMLDCAVAAVSDDATPNAVGISCYSTYAHALLLGLADPCAMSVRQLELAGVSRYLHYSFLVFGPNRIPIVSFFRGQANEGIAHAVMIGEKITSFGGHPTIVVETPPEPEKHDVRSLLQESLDFERRGVGEYRKLLAMCGDDIALEELTRSQIRAETEQQFDNRVFLSGLVANALVAMLLTYLSDRLAVELYIAALVAFGARIFNNLAIIRRRLLFRGGA